VGIKWIEPATRTVIPTIRAATAPEAFSEMELFAIMLNAAQQALPELVQRCGAAWGITQYQQQTRLARLGISEKLSGDLRKALDAALDVAKELKSYRDAVVHCQLVDAGEGLGQLIRRDGQYDVLLSQEALDGLYDRLISVRDELRTLCLIFLILDEAVKNDAQADLNTLLHGPAIQGHVSQVQEHRKARLSLQALGGTQ
jgi:hypothetical protein